MASQKKIITIDGPAGAGKSTMAQALAQTLNWTYLDTGAMYRAVALAAEKNGRDITDEHGLSEVLADLDLTVKPGPRTTRIFLHGQEVTAEIREPRISALASAVSALAIVRRAMVDLQRKIGKASRLVAEGRDMGTVVFPQAGVKFFLNASPQERARRRYKELLLNGAIANLEQVEKEMIERDEADSSRALSPLRPAKDAIIIDSTNLGIDEIKNQMIQIIHQKWKSP
ncbi:MAG: (d)CMP kinase [Deltaproteobacteria bacterium]|nr:(d)CMP kinase [Deltaproteobacteria bacterium]MBW2086095.1 (d)CMP kinase [Deltaproteobacteria bacterium]